MEEDSSFREDEGEDTDPLEPKELQVTQSLLEGIYAHAYHLYQSGVFTQAHALFGILNFFAPSDTRFSLGIAACLHSQKEFILAAAAYETVSNIHPDNPMPLYYQSDCEMHLQNWDKAKKCLEEVIKRGKGKDEFEAVVHRAMLTLNKLKQEHPDSL